MRYHVIADHDGVEKQHEHMMWSQAYLQYGQYQKDPKTFSVRIVSHNNYGERITHAYWERE